MTAPATHPRDRWPRHDWPEHEFAERIERARGAMAEEQLDALLITHPVNFKYFTGLRSEFLVSPTRPWYLLVPREGDAIAIVSEAGRIAMETTTGITEVRTWPSPRWTDEGLTLVLDAIRQLPSGTGRIGCEMGPETRLGIPAQDFLHLAQRVAPSHEFVDGSAVIRTLRMVKSSAEIDALREICQLTSAGYAAVPELIRPGDTPARLCNRLRLFVLGQGASHAPFIASTAAKPCYREGEVILSPADHVLGDGDVLFIDSGFILDGYYSDFDRNWAIGSATDAVRRAYERVYSATEVGIEATRPGARVADVFNAMATHLRPYGEISHPARMGHGLGLALTEPPSVTPYEEVVLRPGMVITIEPTLMFEPPMLMMHEEVVVVTDLGAELLTTRAPAELPVLPAPKPRNRLPPC
jgi:Xaa-Pro dipeptidase